MASRSPYSHWFWHSWVLDRIASAVSSFDSWLYRKRFDRRFR